MELRKNFFICSVSALYGELNVRGHFVMYLVQNVLDMVRHAVEGLLVKVNTLRDRELVPAGTSKDSFFISKTSKADCICTFVNYTTSLIHTCTSSDQKEIVSLTAQLLKERALDGGRYDMCKFPKVSCWRTGDSFIDEKCRNLSNARKLGNVIMKKGLGRYISLPKRSKITCNKKQDSSPETISSIMLEERVAGGFFASYTDYDENSKQFASAAKAFAVLSKELVNVGLVQEFQETMSHMVTKFTCLMENPDRTGLLGISGDVSLQLRWQEVLYTEQDNGQLLLHLLNIDDFIDAGELSYCDSIKDVYGINDIVCCVIPFLVFYKHSDLMVAELKKTGLDLTSCQEKFLRYCSDISESCATKILRLGVI